MELENDFVLSVLSLPVIDVMTVLDPSSWMRSITSNSFFGISQFGSYNWCYLSIVSITYVCQLMDNNCLAISFGFISRDDKEMLIIKSDCFHVCFTKYISGPFVIISLYFFNFRLNFRLVDSKSFCWACIWKVITFFNIRFSFILIWKLTSFRKNWCGYSQPFSVFIDIIDSENMWQVALEVLVENL